MGIKHKAVKQRGERGYASEWNDDHKIDGPVDFEKHQAENLVIENVTEFPSDPVKGQIVYRSDEKRLYIYDGSSWRKYLTYKVDENVDFQKHQAKNLVVDKVSSFPSSPTEGQVVYRYDENKLYVYDGSSWVEIRTGEISISLSYNYKHFENTDVDIYTSTTTILESDTLESGTYLVVAGVHSDLYKSSGGWTKLVIFLTRGDSIIAGTRREIEENVPADAEKQTSLQTSCIVTLSSSNKIKLKGYVVTDVGEVYAHNASLSIVKIA